MINNRYMKTLQKILTFLMMPLMLGSCAYASVDPTPENPVHTHSWESKWTSNNTEHWKKCKDATCNEIKDKSAHAFGNWTIDTYATDSVSGTQHRNCTVCNFKETGTHTTKDPNAIPSSYTPKYQRNHIIFDKAPEIKFQTDSTASNVMEFATKPRKSSNIEPWEESGTFTTSNCESKYDIGAVKGGLKVRGNYTTDYEKKGFRIKFESKKNLFGLNDGNKYKKWVLFADVKDNSMLRNAMSYYLARNMVQDNVFVTDSTPVHLYINNQYWGLYLLAEQKEAKGGRIDLPELPSEDYSGTDIGYTFEIDKYAPLEEAKGTDGDPTFTINPSPTITYKAHAGENRYECNGFTNTYTMLTDIGNRTTQLPFIKNRVEQLYQVLYYASYQNKLKEIVNNQVVDSTETDVETCLAKSFDIDSFVNLYLVNEIVVNPDIGYSSFYLSYDNSADGDKRLRLDNPWDFDTALGVRAGTLEDAQGMFASQSSNLWLSMMYRLSFFKAKVKARYQELKAAELFDKALDMIEDYSINYQSEYVKNFERWPKTLGSNNETNHETRKIVQTFKSERQAEQLVYSWFSDRIEFLDTVFGEGGTEPEVVDPAAFKLTADKTRLEAEQAALNGGCSIGTKTGEGISNDSYVNNLDGHVGATMTFTYNSTKACKALLSAGFSARLTAKTFFGMFSLSVNGSSYTPASDIDVPAQSGNDYHLWTTADIGLIQLKAGSNTIVLTAKSGATNFDYIDLWIPRS